MSKKLKMLVLILLIAISVETFFSMEASEHTHEEQETELLFYLTQKSGNHDTENTTSRNFLENIYKKFNSMHKTQDLIIKASQIKKTATANAFDFKNYSIKESFNYQQITEIFRKNNQTNTWQQVRA